MELACFGLEELEAAEWHGLAECNTDTVENWRWESGLVCNRQARLPRIRFILFARTLVDAMAALLYLYAGPKKRENHAVSQPRPHYKLE